MGTGAGHCPNDGEARWLPSAELDAWLATAMEGLCDAAKRQIRQEIEATFCEVCEDDPEPDLPHDKIRARALIALGDATEALKEYQRQHLTREQAAYVDRLHRLTWWRLGFPFLLPAAFLPWFAALDVFLGLYAWRVPSLASVLETLALGLVSLLVLMAIALWGRRLSLQGRVREVLVGLLGLFWILPVVWSALVYVQLALVANTPERAHRAPLFALCTLAAFPTVFFPLVIVHVDIVSKLRRGAVYCIEPSEPV